MSKVAIIGGSFLVHLQGLSITHSTQVTTPYGEPSAPLHYGLVGEHEVVFLARRGIDGTTPIAPHAINYRANIWALRDAGVTHVIALHSVAAIEPTIKVGDVIIPDQLIDYTYGRESSFFGRENLPMYIGFTDPFSSSTQKLLCRSCDNLGTSYHVQGVIGVTQGPRLETRAELNRMRQDGCSLVTMTAMPEPCLAKEIGLEYGCLALCVRDASSGSIPMPLELDSQYARIELLLYEAVNQFKA